MVFHWCSNVSLFTFEMGGSKRQNHCTSSPSVCLLCTSTCEKSNINDLQKVVVSSGEGMGRVDRVGVTNGAVVGYVYCVKLNNILHYCHIVLYFSVQQKFPNFLLIF